MHTGGYKGWGELFVKVEKCNTTQLFKVFSPFFVNFASVFATQDEKQTNTEQEVSILCAAKYLRTVIIGCYNNLIL